MKRYAVYIIRIDNFKAIECIAENVGLHASLVLEQNHSHKIDTSNYFVAGYERGSERELELAKDLKYGKKK